MADFLGIDALQYSNWDREVLEEIQRGGISAVHVTLCIWEDARDTLKAVGRWNRLFQEHADLVTHARTVDDIRAAKAAGRIGIIWGTQNASLFEDDLDLVQIFHQVGVRIVQLTYN